MITYVSLRLLNVKIKNLFASMFRHISLLSDNIVYNLQLVLTEYFTEKKLTG